MEKVDIYNNKKEKTNQIKGRKELEKGEYRISTHIWIINSDNELLIQKRSEKENMFPNMWAQTGGGVQSGKTSKETIYDECKEELNIEIKEEEIYYIGSYIRTKDIVDVWMVVKDIDISSLILQEEEVAEVKFVDFNTFDEMIEKERVVPSINPSYMLFKNYIEKYKDK